jgi:hypothetical protein
LQSSIGTLKKENQILKDEIKMYKTQPTIVSRSRKRIDKSDDGYYYIEDIKYLLLIGTREEVWNDIAFKTKGNLKKEDI